MARFCTNCGKKLPVFAGLGGQTLCKGCRAACEYELSATRKEILRTKDFTEEQLKLLAKHGRESLLRLYGMIYEQFEADKELEQKEIETLRRMQRAFGLTDDEVSYNERIRPYVYVNTIRRGASCLP